MHYGAHSAQLRDAVAALSRQLANTILPWNDIRALVSNHLTALDKCPGIRPIGIGETLRRIIGKAIYSAMCGGIESLCGADQLYGGVKSGIDGAIDAMNEMYSQNCTSDDWGVLLVDASNALTVSTLLLCYRMHAYCGHIVLFFYLIPTVDGLH